jgi:hypothetical protein
MCRRVRELQAEKRREENGAKNAKRVQIQEVDTDSEDEMTPQSAPRRVQIEEVDSDDEEDKAGSKDKHFTGAVKKGKEEISAQQKCETKRIQIQEVDDDSDDDISSGNTKKQSVSESPRGTKRIQIQEVEEDSDEEVHVHKGGDEANTDSSDDDVVVINKNSAQGSPSRAHRSTKGEDNTCKCRHVCVLVIFL